ncbi:MAG: bifunctional pyr operon transcriptional regulator/uracil phosphoribosyltransferase PyrR [Thermoanaerobaculia bacterium]|nr:bifunctional pyr operon transcriptional regulator/uracil phosphoribosyltransferase PyrR [Thermoanaerobaculia bacterium]
MPESSTILDSRQTLRALRRMAGEIVEKAGGGEDLVLVGIRTRGVPIAESFAEQIEASEGHRPPVGLLDITLYRDDLSTIGPQPVVKETRIPVSIDGRVVVLCDDVLFTGRTIRAALDALADYGRPKAVKLAVLIDRGHRELPIQADVVGRTVEIRRDQEVQVRLESVDGDTRVEVVAA